MTDEKATIIYNPMSGRPGRRGEDVRRMIDLLGERGITAQSCATTAPETATELAKEAVSAGTNIIVSYGGDGTLNEVIQGMAQSDTKLAVWPGGTSNVVARELGVPFETGSLAQMIAAGKTRRIALGLAKTDPAFNSQKPELVNTVPNNSDPEPQRNGRYFIMMAGIGLDASIARGVNTRLKRRTGELAYWLSGLKHLFLWSAEPFSIEVDGNRYEAAFALVGNGKGYGGGMMMTPGAKLEEPLFQVYVLPPKSHNFGYLSALGACLRGCPEVSGATLVKGKHVRANSAHEPWVEADGEIIGPLPMTFDIVADALSVIIP